MGRGSAPSHKCLIAPGDCHAFGSQYPRLCSTLPACACFIALVLITLTGCTNNPYRPSEEGENYLYTTFDESPKHLDPASFVFIGRVRPHPANLRTALAIPLPEAPLRVDPPHG